MTDSKRGRSSGAHSRNPLDPRKLRDGSANRARRSCFFTGDFKFDFTPVDGKLSNITRFGELGHEGVFVFSATRPMWKGRAGDRVSARSPKVTEGVYERSRTNSPDELQPATSIECSRCTKSRRIRAESRRRGTAHGAERGNLRAHGLFKVPKDTRIRLERQKMFRDDQLAILTTGSQGEPMSASSKCRRGNMAACRSSLVTR